MKRNITDLDSSYKGVAGVYKLSIGKHIYIGSSISLYNRLKQHRTDLKCDRHNNQYLQRAVNKYGFDKLKYEILIVLINTSVKALRTLEKDFIEYYNADLNLKLDPVTENNCISTSKPVYQYDSCGIFIKKWESCSEAARALNIDSSGINICCIKPKRQHLCCGFLWSYDCPYPHKEYVKLIYCFSLCGNIIGFFGSTAEIAETLFPDTERKTVLSQLKKKIDSNIPYKNIYLSYNKDFKVDLSYKPRYKPKTELDTKLDKNPIIYVYGKMNNLIEGKRLSDFKNPAYIRSKIKAGSIKYRLTTKNRYYINNRGSIEAASILNGEHLVFNSATQAAEILFNDRNMSKNIYKHISRNTPYKGYYFKRARYNTP